ncbi:MAG: Spy/CpxP family protein refolding chaperone [Thermodesulfobacteriota bacterium]
MKKTCFIILSLILFYSLNAYSHGGFGSAKWWKDAEVVKELNLTNDQVNLIEQIFNSNKGQIADLNSLLKQKQSEFRSKIEDPNSSRDEVLELNDEVVHLKTKLKRLRLDMLLKIREVLTPEQRQNLHKIRFTEFKKKHK